MNNCGRCPKCGSENIEFGDIDMEKESCFQHCICQDCGIEFGEVYKFVEQVII